MSRRAPRSTFFAAVLACSLLGVVSMRAPHASAQPSRPSEPSASPSPSEPSASPSPPAPAASPAQAVPEPLPSAPPASEPPGSGVEVIPPPPAGSLSGALSTAPANAPREACIVVDAAPYGVDPIVARVTTDVMRLAANELGYESLSRDATVAAAQALHMAYPPAPADLWRVTYIARAARGAFARVWAQNGRYIIEITVASLDGRGPFVARGAAGADDLRAIVRTLFREAMPLPGPAAPGAQQGPSEAHGATVGGTAGTPPAGATSSAEPPPAVRRRRRSAPRFALAFQTEAAFGTSQDFFYNHLLGLRLDVRISRDIAIGFYLGYANLRGRDGRASNVLMYGQVEDRVRISSSSDFRIPLRLGIGYLPYNGAYVRLAAGLSHPLSRRVDLTVDLLAPSFWVLPDRTAVSLDLAAELAYRF